MKGLLVLIWLLALQITQPISNPLLGQNTPYFPLRKYTVVNSKPKIVLETRSSDKPPFMDTSGKNWVYYLKSKYFNFSLDSIFYNTEIKGIKRKNEFAFSPSLYIIDIDHYKSGNYIRIKYYMVENWSMKNGYEIFGFEIIYSTRKRKFLKVSCKHLPLFY